MEDLFLIELYLFLYMHFIVIRGQKSIISLEVTLQAVLNYLM